MLGPKCSLNLSAHKVYLWSLLNMLNIPVPQNQDPYTADLGRIQKSAFIMSIPSDSTTIDLGPHSVQSSGFQMFLTIIYI